MQACFVSSRTTALTCMKYFCYSLEWVCPFSWEMIDFHLEWIRNKIGCGKVIPCKPASPICPLFLKGTYLFTNSVFSIAFEIHSPQTVRRCGRRCACARSPRGVPLSPRARRRPSRTSTRPACSPPAETTGPTTAPSPRRPARSASCGSCWRSRSPWATNRWAAAACRLWEHADLPSPADSVRYRRWTENIKQ